MQRLDAFCAIALLSAVASGCALAHERPRDWIDASVARSDASIVGPCTAFWDALATCPADPASALGRGCSAEGAQCGTACCEPGPAMECRGGVWIAAATPDCSGVRCPASTLCGAGLCAPDRVCVRRASFSFESDECVRPPAPIDACDAVPSGALQTNPMGCMATCTCEETREGLAIVIDACPCCD